MAALPVMEFPIARRTLEAITMAERQGHAETEFIKWATLNQEAGKVQYAAYRKSDFNFLRLQRKKVKLQQHLASGGRQKRKPSRNAVYHRRIMEDYFGIPAEETNQLLKQKRVESLWVNKGAEVEDS